MSYEIALNMFHPLDIGYNGTPLLASNSIMMAVKIPPLPSWMSYLTFKG